MLTSKIAPKFIKSSNLLSKTKMKLQVHKDIENKTEKVKNGYVLPSSLHLL